MNSRAIKSAMQDLQCNLFKVTKSGMDLQPEEKRVTSALTLMVIVQAVYCRRIDMSFRSGSSHKGLYEHTGTEFIEGLTSEMEMVTFLLYTICTVLWTIILIF